MWNKRTRLGVTAAIALFGATGVAFSDVTLDWWTIDGGGGMWSTAGSLELSGTIGQPDAGSVMTGGTLELTGGFWAGGSMQPAPSGDFDNDGDVDLADFAFFQQCFGESPVSTECSVFDFYDNDVIDLADFASFAATIMGPE